MAYATCLDKQSLNLLRMEKENSGQFLMSGCSFARIEALCISNVFSGAFVQQSWRFSFLVCSWRLDVSLGLQMTHWDSYRMDWAFQLGLFSTLLAHGWQSFLPQASPAPKSVENRRPSLVPPASWYLILNFVILAQGSKANGIELNKLWIKSS